jgi:signal peptidase I
MDKDVSSSVNAHSKNTASSWRSQWNQLLKQIIVILIAVRIIHAAVIAPCHVPSGSMLPTMEVGDILWMSKWPYGWTRYSLPLGNKIPYFKGRIGGTSPQRGDIIVFAPPSAPDELWVKRVVGVAGDRIQMIKGILNINESPVSMKPVSANNVAYDGKTDIQAKRFKVAIPTHKGWAHYEVFKQTPFGHGQGDNTASYTVPSGHLFVMGDNWDGSGDSRFMDGLGFVPLDNVVGRPWFTYLSVNTQNISWKKPWTWLTVPFNIRWKRCGYHAIQPVITDSVSVSDDTLVPHSKAVDGAQNDSNVDKAVTQDDATNKNDEQDKGEATTSQTTGEATTSEVPVQDPA